MTIEPGKSYQVDDFAFDWHSDPAGWIVFRLSTFNACGDYDATDIEQMIHDFPELSWSEVKEVPN